MKVENVLRVQNIQKVRNDEFFWKICGGFLEISFWPKLYKTSFKGALDV